MRAQEVESQTETTVACPKQFKDDVAKITEWKPFERFGSGGRSHRLVRSSAHCMVFRPTFTDILFTLVLTFIGLVILALAYGEIITHVDFIEILLPLVVGGSFFSVGIYAGWQLLMPIRFDRQNDRFKIGFFESRNPLGLQGYNPEQSIARIHAIQLLTFLSEDSESQRISSFYELNLVFKDGGRHPVICHGDLKNLRNDAAELARFLNVPVWDAIRD